MGSRRALGAWVLDWTRAQTGVMRGDAESLALRGIVADLLSTRDGTTYAVERISGVDQRIDLPGDHPLVGRFLPDLWWETAPGWPTTVTTVGSCRSTALRRARSPASPGRGPRG